MKILIINSGSSSLKYQLIDMENESVLCKGSCERIGIADGIFTMKYPDREQYRIIYQMPSHTEAIKIVLDTLVSPEHGVIASVSEVGAVGHRVLHGGDKFSGSVLVTEAVKDAIRECIPLGPLHNPANLKGIESCEKIMPGVPQVAVFDTGFHQTMPAYAYRYGLPKKYYEEYKIRRYGFHGTSHKFISRRAAEFLGKKPEELRLVTLHLGNGSSLCAVKNGVCVDTSMGLTPLEGCLMGTRCGSIDPAAVTYIMDKEHLSPAEMDTLMNKQSGLKAVSGISPDFRDINAAADIGDEDAKLALDMFGYQCKKIMAGYIAAMGGCDAVVFTAGVGENRAETRARITSDLEFLGIKIDPELNEKTIQGKEADISAHGATIRTLVLATNEELEIARETKEIVSKL